MEKNEIADAYLEEVGRDYPDKEQRNKRTAELAQMLGVPPDAVQVIDLERWRAQDESFKRETRRLMARARKMKERKNG